MQWRDLGAVPYLAQVYPPAHDRKLYVGLDYYNNDIIRTIHEGDVRASLVRSKKNCDTVHDKEEMEDDNVLWTPTSIYGGAYGNQILQDHGIIYERHNKGIPMLHILDVKRLQHGSEDHVIYSWKLDEATKECKLEIIDQSDKNEQGEKKDVRFSFATNDTDKLLSQVVDGYEVKYMLRTNAMRLRLELEIVLFAPDTCMIDFNSVSGKIMLAIERDGKPYTIMDLLHDRPPSKKPKLNHSNNNNTFKLSSIRIIPRNLRPMMKFTVALKDRTGTLDVDNFQNIFPYNIPVDQRDYIDFNNGYIMFNVFWGCSLRKEKGVCTGVCTCEPGEFIDFPGPVDIKL